MAAESVHDRDGVDEDVQSAGTRPQGEDEADRHDVETTPTEDVVKGRGDDLLDRRRCQRLRRPVQDPVLEHADLGDVVALGEVADGAGQAEDQRRQRQDGEERGLAGQPGHPVGEAGGRRARCEPAQRGAQLVPRHGDYRSHMRTLAAAAIFSAVITFSSALALRAPDASVSVAAVALVTAFIAWLAALHSTELTSGLALTSPAAAVTLAAVRRTPVSTLLPLLAAQAVGAVAAGFGALGLDSQLGGALTWTDPSPVAVGVGVAFVGLLASWTVLIVDGGENAMWAGLGPVASASALGVGLAAALNPAVVVGLATAGIIGWITAGIAAGVGLLAALVGAYVIGILTPADVEAA